MPSEMPLPVVETASESFQAGPRADFICSRCEETGRQTEPVTLPMRSAWCPTCGKKKWLQRVWSGASSMPTVIQADRHAKSNHTRQLRPEAVRGSRDALADQWDHQQVAKRALIEGRAKGTAPQVMPAASLSQFGLGLPQGKASVVPRHAMPALDVVRGPRPGPGSQNGGGRLNIERRDGKIVGVTGSL